MDLFGGSKGPDTISANVPINDIVIVFTFEDVPNFITFYNKEFIYDHKRKGGGTDRLQIKQKFKTAFQCKTKAETKTVTETGVEVTAGNSGSQCARPTSPARTDEIRPTILPRPNLSQKQKSSQCARPTSPARTDEIRSTVLPRPNLSQKQKTSQPSEDEPTELYQSDRSIKIRRDYISFKMGDLKKRLKITAKPNDKKKWMPKEPKQRAELFDSVIKDTFDIFDRIKLNNFESYYFVPLEDFMSQKQTDKIRAHWLSINEKDQLPKPMGYVLMDSSSPITHFTGKFLMIRSI